MSHHRRIGQFTVSSIGLGAMPLSTGGSTTPSHDEAVAVVHAALDAGITLIDTADIYAPSWDTMGHNESIVAEALRTWAGDASNVVVATKGGITRAEGERWGRDGSPAYIREAVERSRERLGVDAIDLYYWHRPDRSRLYAEVVETFGQLKADGIVKEVGVSNANVEELQVAVDVLGEGGLAAVQNEFSPKFNHTSWRELLWCGKRGIAFLPWSPLAAGPLAAADGPLARLAARRGVTPSQLALAWLLKRSPAMLPIPGTANVEHLQQNVAAAEIELSDAEFAELSKAVAH